MRSFAAGLAAVALSTWGAVATTGCAPTLPQSHVAAAIPPEPIPDEDFAIRLNEVLRDGSRSESRHKRLLGVVHSQLTHAGSRFDHGATDRGTQSVLGGMYLLRSGEESALLFDAKTKRAVDGAVDKLAARGDIGRSRVLLELQLDAATSVAERREIQEHIAALDRFYEDTATGKPIERIGDAERASVAMALLRPEHLDRAMGSIDAWINLGIRGNVAFQQGRRPSQEEGLEIARALGSGAATVVSLMLRYGDLEGAIGRVMATSARRVMDPLFFAQLRQVQRQNTAASWRDLFDALGEDVGDRVGGNIGIDEELYASARFAILLEAFRLDTEHVATTHELARALTGFGLSEAVPLVLDDPIDSGTAEPREVVDALRLVGQAVVADARVNDVQAARRTILASKEMLDHAKSALGERAGAATVADLRYNMATVLLKGGYAKDADVLLSQALDEAPRSGGYLLRAQIRRQRNEWRRALEDVAQITGRSGDAVDVAEARLLEYEIARDRGDQGAASNALAAAMDGANGAALQPKRTSAQRARALVVLGRVRFAYGDRDGMRRAFERAMSEVSGDAALTGTTMLQAASAALALGDREGVRATLRKGVEAEVPQQDLVYGAILLMLAEQQQSIAAGSEVTEILDRASGQSTWVGRLASWARGKLSDEKLIAAAPSEAARVESTFYVAMARRAHGETQDDTLRRIADSPVIQLREVQMARDVLAPRLEPMPAKESAVAPRN